ncbi:MAG: hypothetical protein KIT84_19215 [Labilithrix sp.]|nr:hypothetical protein [Labilithrix sp.]MCW5813165.1 hypothetical protein [Labilithrix sp.]
MTPRQMDVAFVLESVAGVRGVYAVEPGRVPLDFVVHVEQSTRVLASAHYALLRVVTHAECERILLFHDDAPPGLIGRLRPLVLSHADRQSARARVPPAPPFDLAPPFVFAAPSSERVATPSRRALELLIVDGTERDLWAVREVFDVEPATCSDVLTAVGLARARPFDAILCDAGRAFGEHGLLAALPIETAQRVLVVAARAQLVDARWRLQGTERILERPLLRWRLRQRVLALVATTSSASPAPPAPPAASAPPAPPAAAVAAAPLRRVAAIATVDESLRVLFVDLDAEQVRAFREPLGGAAGELLVAAADDAAERVLAERFHLVVCSASSALHPTGFLASLARIDMLAADRVVVLVPALDAAFVAEELAKIGRESPVLALPLEQAAVRRVVVRAYPPAAAQVAVADVSAAATEGPPSKARKVAYRRLAVLVVDDDTSTKILFSASAAHPHADIALASTTMEAFEHVVTRAVDVLVVSASMRGEGEPFYRVLWRLQPALKSRTVLIVGPDAMPPSAPPSRRPRILERPVSRDAVGRIVTAFQE